MCLSYFITTVLHATISNSYLQFLLEIFIGSDFENQFWISEVLSDKLRSKLQLHITYRPLTIPDRRSRRLVFKFRRGSFSFSVLFSETQNLEGGLKLPPPPTLTTPLQVTGKWFSNSFGSHSTVQQIMPFPYSQDYQYVRCRKDFISEKSGFHLMFMYCNHFS